MGYSLVDDLLSGMGLAIGWSVATSIPVIGGPLATLLWDGPFPGGTAFESRLYIAHVLLVPVLIGTLIGLHLLLVSLLTTPSSGGRARPSETSSACASGPRTPFARSRCSPR